SPWAWAGLVVVVLLHAFVMWLVTAFVELDTQGSCREPAAPGDLTQARADLLVAVGVALAPWLVAVVATGLRRRPWVRILVGGLLVATVPVWALIHALASGPADWSSDWCLF
ncbi:hypothetical protein ACH5WX_11110, partial [Nocardioides sp. CER28]